MAFKIIPYEKRIRMRYMALGIMIGITVIFFSLTAGGLTQIAIKALDIIPDNANTTLRYDILTTGIYGGITGMFCVFLYSMWYSNTPKELYPDETIGLKSDYDAVKGI